MTRAVVVVDLGDIPDDYSANDWAWDLKDTLGALSDVRTRTGHKVQVTVLVREPADDIINIITKEQEKRDDTTD